MSDIRFTVQGTVLSKVPCEIERHRRAEQLGVPVEEIPLTYGSTRIGVNYIKLENTVYCLQRFNSTEVDEERYILEISYRYDLNIKDGITLLPEHNLVHSLEEGKLIDISMSSTYTNKKHNTKLVRPRPGYVIKSYFTKAWADSIVEVTEPNIIPTENITFDKLFSKLSSALNNRELVFS